VLASLAVAGITVALSPFGDGLPRAIPALLLLAPVLVAGLVSGRFVAAAITVESAFAFAVFLPPVGLPLVELTHDVIALGVFAVVTGALGVLVSTVVTSERRRSHAERAQIATLQHIDEQRSALLRSVSHDLRTPLASIRAVVTDLRTDAPYDRTTRDELLGLVADETERLDRLVANLLSLSRIEAGAFLPDRVPLDLAELLDACTVRLRRELDEVEVVIDVPDDLPPILGDHSQIDQVLTNLVENAARHSPANGRLTIRARREGDLVAIAVSDEGPGIPDHLRAAVLEPFRGAGSSASTGIGLAICRSIIQAHDGTITVDGQPDGGARITITVPHAPPNGPGGR
jgi:K+-sensing histidine kinase KdpD